MAGVAGMLAGEAARAMAAISRAIYRASEGGITVESREIYRDIAGTRLNGAASWHCVACLFACPVMSISCLLNSTRCWGTAARSDI